MVVDHARQVALRVKDEPSSWLSGYSDFIIKNASAVSQIESALRSLTYIIPGRFKEAELASETRTLHAHTHSSSNHLLTPVM